MEYTTVTPYDIADMDGMDDWRVVLGALRASFRFGTFTDAAALVTSIAEAADVVQHHPDVDLRYPGVVHVLLTTHATNGLTTADVKLAREISRLASRSDASSEPATAQDVEVAIDTMDADRIRPFWAAVLGYDDVRGVLVDPRRRGPVLWFQQMDEPRIERNRFHLDVSVPHDVAQARIVAALDAGGTMVTDRFARMFWVLADADGNEACICTWQDR